MIQIKQQPVFAEAIVFEEMRMQVRDERSKMEEQLISKIYRPTIQPKKKTRYTMKWAS